MRLLLIVVGLCLAAPMPAVAADRTTTLLAKLDTCDRDTITQTGPRVNVLLALADGRSAQEFADIIRGPRNCTGYVAAVGHGEDEVVLVGAAYARAPNIGAILWVDRGWWRAATAPIGYTPYPWQDLRRGSARELFVGVASGGSAGIIGAMAVRLDRRSAVTFWQLPPSLAMEIGIIRLLDDDHLLIEGRDTGDRLFTWQSHAGWPGGAQRMFTRSGATFVLTAARQARDPSWLMTGFIGGLFDGDGAIMGRFATPEAVVEGLTLPRSKRGPYVSPVRPFADMDLTEREYRSWKELPAASRVEPPQGPVWGVVTLATDDYPSWADVLLRFDRQDSGWTITSARLLNGLPGGTRLAP